MSQQAHHLKALLKKNFILWKRNRCRNITEIILPFSLCIIIMSIIRSSVGTEIIPEESYVPSTKDHAILYPNMPTGVVDSSGKAVKPPLVNCLDRTRNGKGFRNGYVALVPQSNELIDQVGAMLRDVYGYQTRGYDTLDQLFQYTTSLQYDYDVCFAIEIPTPIGDGQYQYKLVFNNTGPPTRELDDIPDTLRDTVYEYKTEFKNPLFDLWQSSGFLNIQNYIDNLILRKETGKQTAQISATVYPIKSEEYKKDEIDFSLHNNFAPFVTLPLVLSFLSMTQLLLIEKEKKIREGMKIMGMKNSSFYLSWIIHYLVIYTFTALLMALALKLTVFKHSNYFFLFIWYWMFCISLIFQSIFISSFFSKSNVGSIVARLFYLLNFLIDFFVQNGTYTKAQYTAASFSSHTGIVRSCEVIIVLEANSVGVSFGNADTIVNNFSVALSMLMCLANIAFFAILSLYLDQVIPNEFGKKKKPLFFLDFIFDLINKKKDNLNQPIKNIRNRRIADQDIESMKKTSENVEEVTQLLKDQELRNEVLKITNLKKIYYGREKPFNAVSDLNLTMYKNQIFVLLGHNGAGKTTTLSMLSGLLNISDGYAEVNGLDVETQMDDIRKFMGVCPQHDILFDNLTVREHLELFASFKGMTDQALIKSEVDKFIDDVGLREKTDVLSKNLSGGQKRRLSVAIAFIGGSQLIYLDEPTSGMDTSARRYIWDMLKQYRHDRIVILTTHFMDEADYLGDRIAIMGKGKLICCGSSEFLKDRFGVGYNLTIVKEDNNVSSDPIINYIKSIIPSANILSNVSSEIAVQLKSDSASFFPQMFKGLDEQKKQLQIESYGISITTLEEVFLRVAEIEHELDYSKMNKVQHKPELDEVKYEENIDNFDLNSVRIKSEYFLFFVHFLALVKKRMLYFKRDTKGLLCEVFIPFVVIAAGLAITLIQIIVESPSLLIQPSIYQTPLNIIYSGTENTSQMSSLMSKFDPSDWNAQLYNTNSKNEWDEKNYELRSVSRKGSYFITKVDTTNQIFEYDAEVQTISKDSPPLFVNQMNNAILRLATGDSNKNIQITFNPFPLPLTVKGFENTSDGIIASFIFSIALSLIPSSLIAFTVKEREDKVKHQQLVSGVNLKSYWLSNYFVDMTKHLIPACLSILMVLAYNIDTFSGGNNFKGMAALFILYGWAMIPFTYLLGFLFTNAGPAQVFGFFFNFLLGAIGPILIMILRLISSTRSVALKIQWIFRLFPSFCFGYGVLNMANKSLYATVAGQTKQLDTFDMDIAGGDVMLLAIQGFVYFYAIFLVEYLSHKKSMKDLFRKNTNEIKYMNQCYDTDVQKEMELVAKTDPKEYAVKVQDIQKIYYATGNEPKVAVDRVSFGIKEGECFGLLGVNGAGKTTTFKILAGEIQSSSGSAYIKGYNLSTQMSEAQKHIGYCPQFDALLDNLTAREHLEFYAAIKGIPFHLRAGLVSQKIKEMGLTEFEHKCAGTYSGGNKRKLSVAIAMLGNPPIVFLDEPSTGMDPEARRFMWNVISRISTKRKQSSIILTTHSMEEAEALCTKLTIMVNGSFKCLGNLTQIKNKYGQGYEVVVKTEIPKENVEEQLKKFGFDIHKRLTTLSEVESVLQTLGQSNLMKEFSEEGLAKLMYQNIVRNKGITAEQLIEFVCIEEDGEKIKHFIQSNLGEFFIIEHFSNLYRFKIDNTKNSIGKVFEIFEHNKSNLKITSYNVRQATIEQIFNNFAEGRYENTFNNINNNNKNEIQEPKDLINNNNQSQNKNQFEAQMVPITNTEKIQICSSSQSSGQNDNNNK